MGTLTSIAATAMGYWSVSLAGASSVAAAISGVSFLFASIRFFAMALDSLGPLTFAQDKASDAVGAIAFSTMAAAGAQQMWQATTATGKLGTYAGVAGFACAAAIVGYTCKVYAAVCLVDIGY
jgi:apolipoprotein N-acyltransferase